jgi:hypothetical protein
MDFNSFPLFNKVNFLHKTFFKPPILYYIMKKEDIIGGLKSALSRGESMNKAMMTFFNAGYTKEDIESAAGLLHMQGFQQSVRSIPQKNNLPKKIQRVSNYEQSSGRFGFWIVVFLSFILIVLVGVLVGLVFFRENLVGFFNKFF